MTCLTITLNAAIDATYVVERFAHGGLNRVIRKHTRPGGKGNNVARIVAAMGHPVTATGFLGGDTGVAIEAGMRQARVATCFRRLVAGESRTCHTILEQDTGAATEILETGPNLTGEDMKGMISTLPDLLDHAEIVVISGSAPAGATAVFLSQLARTVRRSAARLVIDSSGSTLSALLDGRPDLVKPNEAELRTVMGRSGTIDEQIAFVRADLLPNRMAPKGRVIISRGDAGALLITATRTLQARAPTVDVVNTVGCGDALLAGFVAGWLDKLDDAEALRTAVATGTAAALQEVAGEVDALDVERLRLGVDVTEYG